MDTQLKALAWRGAPVLIDVLAIVLYRTLVPRLTTRLQQKSVINALIIGGVYLLFCGAVFAIRKLEGEGEKAYIESNSTLAFFGVTFGIWLSFMMADASGVFDSLDAIDVNSQNVLTGIAILAGTVAWLALVFLYPAVLMTTIKPSIARESGRFFWFQLLGVLGINLMIVVTMAHWDAYFADTEPYEGLGFGAKALIFAVTFAFWLLFYGPPRLVFMSRNSSTAGVVTFLMQMGYFVWNALSGTAWI